MKGLRLPFRAAVMIAVILCFLAAHGFGIGGIGPRTSPSNPPYPIAAAQGVLPAGELRELAIDDGVAECVLGPAAALQGSPGFGWVNKLTPASYPATLRTITVGFNRAGPLVQSDKLFRIVVLNDPESDGPAGGQQPDATFIGRVRGRQQIMTFNLITPVRIEGGSFVVGVIDDFAVSSPDENQNSTFPALMDVPGRSSPQGSESFFTQDGGATWRRLSEAFSPGPAPCNGAGSFLIRATVETGTADVLSATRIKDPDAVEPWAVSILGGDAIVANYVSDNLTLIKTSDNSFTNMPVGDGPGGTPDGPAGVALLNIASANAVRAYVSLFGSNTIASKEFPIDYSTVGPGRIQVLGRTIAGTFLPISQISVGKGPRFPAVGSGGKLYVPCAGSNRVDVIDTIANQKIREIAVGVEPTSCTAGLGGSKVYVTNFGDDTISVIDSRTDQVIKTMRVPQAGVAPPPPLKNPWNAEISRTNGNLYVTYWGASGDVAPNGGIVEYDTCSDAFLRILVDDTTAGSGSGSEGASGIAAPSAPLVRDSATGLTAEAGGGGGGNFGIASCASRAMVFTNDGSGVIGVLDTLINQVVSSPPIAVTACPKPRETACTTLSGRHVAYVACGQPDSSVLVVSMPELRENIANLPTVSTAALFLDSSLEISGTGFSQGISLELIVNGRCVGFRKNPKIKKGTRIIQKGKLTDGRSIGEVLGSTSAVRLIAPDGEVRLVNCCAIP